MNVVFILSILLVIYMGLAIFIPHLRFKYRMTRVLMGTVTCIGAFISGIFFNVYPLPTRPGVE